MHRARHVFHLLFSKHQRFASSNVVASYSSAAGLRLGLRWVPREWSKEADDLTNGDLSVFSNSLRVQVDVATMEWLVLPELLSEGLRFQDEVAAVRAELGSGCCVSGLLLEPSVYMYSPHR